MTDDPVEALAALEVMARPSLDGQEPFGCFLLGLYWGLAVAEWAPGSDTGPSFRRLIEQAMSTVDGRPAEAIEREARESFGRGLAQVARRRDAELEAAIDALPPAFRDVARRAVHRALGMPET